MYFNINEYIVNDWILLSEGLDSFTGDRGAGRGQALKCAFDAVFVHQQTALLSVGSVEHKVGQHRLHNTSESACTCPVGVGGFRYGVQRLVVESQRFPIKIGQFLVLLEDGVARELDDTFQVVFPKWVGVRDDREATDEFIDEVIAHLDNELEIGAVKMTVEMDDHQEEHSLSGGDLSD